MALISTRELWPTTLEGYISRGTLHIITNQNPQGRISVQAKDPASEPGNKCVSKESVCEDEDTNACIQDNTVLLPSGKEGFIFIFYFA